jgi:mono/diheme cytochrome c family protein
MKLRLLCCICVSLALEVAASSADLLAQSGKSAPVPRAKAVELYDANCQVCHGPRGEGTPLMKDLAFKGRKWKHGSRQQDVIHTITNGVPGTPMLPFKGRLSSPEIAALASLVRSYGTGSKPAVKQ